jgi:glycine dehydrogenase
MKSIWEEIREIRDGRADKNDNVLRNAPHTCRVAAADKWEHGYGREKAVFPLRWVIENKFWPSVGRIDDGYGDRNLVCTCDPIDSYRMEALKF